MKKEKFQGKLSLNKTTIKNLNNEDMRRVNGGLAVHTSCGEPCCPQNTFVELRAE